MSIEELDKRIDNLLSGWELPKGNEKVTIWGKIISAIRTKQGKVITLEKWHWVAAACLAVVLLSYAAFYSGNFELSTSNNQFQAVILPDGSSVEMNAASTISYNKYLWNFNRSIRFTGEGYFKVQKGSQFNVITKSGDVQVLGTSFNVYARKEILRVVCYQGKVGVSNKFESETIEPGEQVEFISNQPMVKSANLFLPKEPKWIGGVFSFSEATLSELFDEIERQYDVIIVHKDDGKDMRFTGEWNNTMSLDAVLEIVCLPFGLEAKLDKPGRYTIQSKVL